MIKKQKKAAGSSVENRVSYRNWGINKKVGFMTFLLIAAMIAACGCSSVNPKANGLAKKDPAEAVRIGVFEPLSGSDEKQGSLELQGIELAHDLYPKVLGKPIELVYGDNRSTVSGAEEAAEKLADSQVAVVLGSYGNTLSLAGSDTFKKAKLPAVGVTCTNPLITQSSDYYARVCFADSFQGTAAAKYVVENLGYRTAAVILKKDDDYSAALSHTFTEKMSSLTGDENAVLQTLEYEASDTDFKDQLKMAEQSGAPLVYLPGDAKTSAAIIRQARELGMTNFFFGTDAWETSEFLKDGGSSVEGAAFTSLFDSDQTLTDTSAIFLNAYHQKYGADQEPSGAAALGFDAYLVAIDAIHRAQTAADTTAVRDAILKTKEFQGATGSITIDKNGDPIKTVVIKAVENGSFVHKSTAEPSWQPM